MGRIMIDILHRITQYRNDRNWTEYELARRSELPQSTISSWYRKNMLPSLASLDKIASAFGLTLSQFLAEDENVIASVEEKLLLHEWNKLDKQQQEFLLKFLQSL